jgi:transglutaminase-like putative cysteine protease
MLRTLGIPARLVNGFRRGEFNGWGSDFVVRGSNAHSWAEAYFKGIGWVEFDPTPPDSTPATPAWVTVMGNLLDGIDLFWTTEIVTYDFWKQVSFLRSVQERLAALSEWAKRRFDNWKESLKGNWISSPADRDSFSSVAVLLWALPVVGLWLLFRFRLALLAPFVSLLPTSRSRRLEGLLVAQCYFHFLRKLEARGVRRRPGETARELAGRLETDGPRDRAARFADLYYRRRYGPDAGGGVKDLLAALEEL